MSTAQTLIEQGRVQGLEQGLERGRVEGQRHLLMKQLSLRFGVLSAVMVARLQNADEELLEQWAERVLSAASLEDLVGGR